MIDSTKSIIQSHCPQSFRTSDCELRRFIYLYSQPSITRLPDTGQLMGLVTIWTTLTGELPGTPITGSSLLTMRTVSRLRESRAEGSRCPTPGRSPACWGWAWGCPAWTSSSWASWSQPRGQNSDARLARDWAERPGPEYWFWINKVCIINILSSINRNR